MNQEKSEENIKTCKIFHVDRYMIPSKLSLASLYCSQSYLPYLSVFLTSVGMTSTEAGIIVGLRSLPALFASPLWGVITDMTGRRKLIITILWIATILLVFPLPCIGFLNEQTINHENSTSLKVSPERITYSGNKKLFYITLTACLLSACFEQPLIGFIDSAVMDVVTERKHATYGQQRMVAGLATVGVNFVAGLAAEKVVIPFFPMNSGVFIVSLPCFFCLLPSALALLSQVNDNLVVRKKKFVFSKTIKTCKSLETLMFLTSVFFMGTSQGIRFGYLSMYLNDELQASKTFVGLCYSLSAATSTLFFPFASFIIEKIGGTKVGIQMAIFACVIRFLVMTYIKVKWLVLPVQVMYGISYAIYMTAAAEHTQMISSKEISATMFGIVSSVYVSFGALFGNIVGGIVYDIYGGRGLTMGSALVFLGWFLIAFTYDRMKTKKYSLRKAQLRHFPSNILQDGLILDNRHVTSQSL